MIDHTEDPIASALHIPCDEEIARLKQELAEARAERDQARIQAADAIVERDRWIARVKWLERLLDSVRELLR